MPEGQLQDFDVRVSRLEHRLAELERPTGTQVAETVATIDDLEALQIVPSANVNQGTGFTMSTTMTTRATFNFTVPDGFTRALIVASGFVYSGTATAGGDRIYGNVRIGASDGPESIAFMTSTMLLGGVSAFHAVLLTGLSDGQVIAVATRARLQTGPGDAAFNAASTATVAGTALFLK